MISSVDQKLSSLQSLLAQRPFPEVLSGLGAVELHEDECGDLKPAALLIHAHPWGIHVHSVSEREQNITDYKFFRRPWVLLLGIP